MYKIIGGRGTGKTYRLLEEANKVNAIIICRDPRALKEKARSWGFNNVEFVGYKDQIFYYYNKPVFIDELEAYAQALAGRTFSGYTYTIIEDENK